MNSSRNWAASEVVAALFISLHTALVLGWASGPIPEASASESIRAQDYNYSVEVRSAPLQEGHEARVTLNPFPSGLRAHTAALLRREKGTTEVVTITGVGASCQAGNSNAVCFVPSRDYTGMWTIQSATSGIQEALNVAKETGGRILVSPGVHRLEEALHLPSNVILEGSGVGATILESGTAGNDGIVIHDASTIARSSIRDLQIRQASDNPRGVGINLSASDITLENIWVSGWGVGIRLSSCSDDVLRLVRVISNIEGIQIIGNQGAPTVGIQFFRVQIQKNKGTGLLLDGNVNDVSMFRTESALNRIGFRTQSSPGSGVPSQLFLHNLVVDSNSQDGISLATGNMFVLIDPWVSNRGTGENFSAAGITNLSVIGGEIYNCYGNGMHLREVHNVIVTGVQISWFGKDSPGKFDGVLMDGHSTNLTLTSNRIWGQRAGRYGISIEGNASAYLIENNNLNGNLAGPINDTVKASDRMVSGNLPE